MSIEVCDVKKIFSKQYALDGVSFSLNEGEIVGFLGPNGAGKSTLMKIIGGAICSTSGEVKVLGVDVDKNPREVQKNIGFLPEHNPLYDELYVREYLRHVGELYGVKDLKRSVEEVVKRCGITKEAQKKIGTLSKGYKQRVGLAQALIHDPKVLILDEPMNGLDPNQIIEIRELIREVSQGKTVLFSSHIMHEVSQMCDRVVIIDNGKVVADDQCDILLQSNKNSSKLAVVFKHSLTEEDKGALSLFSQVLERDGYYELIGSPTDNFEEKVFRFAVERDNPLLQLKTIKSDLEDVFKSLTIR
ncbi:ATP-binding cassette domain-containing protein [Halosquirtibacter xylanolyticus]|uniref:ATP-binding cassette domain-containing protein n=1 Tax=Halosquirtibacter xylanolyticus TaxID=3374599 RepID=UPI003747F714|nr:ATP-binding cassette domain-containing protein [Prolixibacteraceae bacterium]